MALTLGTRLGPYEILAPIGAGGMGQVYRARDTRLGRDVALKTLNADVASDTSRQQRFETEARAVAALSHPNIVAVFDVGKAFETPYIISELVDGKPLREIEFELSRMLDIAVQIAAGLAAAHAAGIIHRDLKPDNIMVTRDGLVKILDFGIAKMRSERTEGATATQTIGTGPGVVLGTLGYMAPEQVLGLTVDHRADLFSFGVVLYEMVAKKRPFSGSSPMAVADAILHAPPQDLDDIPLPGRLKAIIGKLLEKNAANRYASALEVRQELQALQASLTPAPRAAFAKKMRLAAAALSALIAILGGWFWYRSSRERWVLQTATPEIARLVEAGEYVKAATLAQQARAVLPNNRTLEDLWIRATGEVSIASVPSGAQVSIRLYKGDPNAWKILGVTPIRKVRLGRDAFVLKVVKQGFANEVFIGEPPDPPPPGGRNTFDVTIKLRPQDRVLPDMVAVPGGRVILSYPFAYAPAAQVEEFLIDRHEVTNEEYKRFVDAGGYRRPEFWKQRFVEGGETVSWENAIARFHDATGRPGPAAWEVGDYPNGRAKYPVAGVSWYEAAAYAEFVGKSLPTAYHWTGASQSGFAPVIIPGSNFRHDGTQPVGSEGALSGYGTTDMAGNVKEWCLNETQGGKRLILGGGFGDPAYMFHDMDAQSPWDRGLNFGFRCVKLDSPPKPADVAHLEVVTRDYRKEKPVSDEVFKAYTALYAYDKGELNAQVEETAATEGWSLEKVTFDAAYGNERVPAYLLLPKNSAPPFQTVVYFPGAFAFMDEKIDLASFAETRGLFLKSGRALIFPIYKGIYERRDGFIWDRNPPAFQRDHEIAWAKDLGRLLDYLETRKEFDVTKVAYFGDSIGACQALFLLAVEKRIKAAILSSGGLNPIVHYLPEADPFNFVPHVTIPVLMLNGRYDNSFPLESCQRPLFELLGTPAKDKKHVIYESGHGAFPRPAAVRESLDWLDKYLGPVQR